MRYIQKTEQQPEVISKFVAHQHEMRAIEGDLEQFSVAYQSFAGNLILPTLLQEQHGLCAYTGVALDDARLGPRQPRTSAPPRHDHWFIPHVEHLKSQEQCRRELEEQGKIPGTDLGEDMDYHNMVAALQVSGVRGEWFGASHRENRPISVWPTHPDCEARFHYSREGEIMGVDPEARDTIAVLRLDHITLRRWRKGAIEGFLDPAVIVTREDFEKIVQLMDQLENDRLEEFCYVVKAIAKAELSRT